MSGPLVSDDCNAGKHFDCSRCDCQCHPRVTDELVQFLDVKVYPWQREILENVLLDKNKRTVVLPPRQFGGQRPTLVIHDEVFHV